MSEEEKIILKIFREIGVDVFGSPNFRATVRVGVRTPSETFREIGRMVSVRGQTAEDLESKIDSIKSRLEKLLKEKPELLKKFGALEEIELE